MFSWLSSKEFTSNTEDIRDVGLIPGSGRSPGEEKWQPTPVFLPGESYGQESLASYSPWGWKRLGGWALMQPPYFTHEKTWDLIRLSYLLNQEVKKQQSNPRHVPCATYQLAVSSLCHLLIINKSSSSSVSLCVTISVAGERLCSPGCDMWSRSCHDSIPWINVHGRLGALGQGSIPFVQYLMTSLPALWKTVLLLRACGCLFLPLNSHWEKQEL